MSLVLGLKHSCPLPREGLSSEGLSLALDFFVPLASSLVSSTPPMVYTRGGVEDKRLEAKAKDTKKKSEAKAKDSFSEDRTSRGQGQECLRPRPNTGASVLRKKKKNVFKNFFQAISNLLAYPEFLIGGGLNHKSHEMMS